MSLESLERRPRAFAAMGKRAARHRLRPEPRPAATTRIRLWLPLTPLFWLLSPFAILLSPLICLAPPLWGVNPYVASVAVGRMLVALGGTDIDVDCRDARVRITIF
jgi:hypothetical protein